MDGKASLREHGHGSGPAAAAYLQNGGEACLLTAGADGKIKLWDSQGDVLRETDDNDDAFTCLAVSPDGSFLAAGDDNKVTVRPVARISISKGLVWHCASVKTCTCKPSCRIDR